MSGADLELDDVVTPAAGLAVEEVDGDLVVFDKPNSRLHVLNPSAMVIWQLLDGAASLRDVASTIASTYSVDVRQVELDVLGAVRQLSDEDLVDVRSSAASG